MGTIVRSILKGRTALGFFSTLELELIDGARWRTRAEAP